MGVTIARVGRALAMSAALAAAPASAGEPLWQNRPLGHWVDRLQTAEPAGRIEAARALAEIALANGPGSIEPAQAALVDALTSPLPELRLAACAALEQAGPGAGAAVPLLGDLIEQDADAGVRMRAGLALTRIAPSNPAVVEISARVMGRDADARVRQAAAAALVQAGAAAAPALPALQRALTDGDPLVRVFAAAAVGQLGETGTAIPVLLDGLSHVDAGVRAEAAGQLAAVAPAHAPAVGPLTSALRDGDPQVRLAAADALGRIGRPAAPALQSLWRLIRDSDEAVREGALRAIRRIRD